MSGRRDTSSPEAPHGFRRGLVLFPRAFGLVIAAVIALVVVAFSGATAASAYWPASGTGSTTAAVATLAPPTNVAVPATSNSNVAVSWTASAGTLAPTGYYVTRVTGATSVLACGSSPTVLVTGTSCTDASAPEGTHKYVVTAVHRSWTAVGAASGNVTVTSTTDLRFAVQPSASITAGSAIPSVTVELLTIWGLPVWQSNVPVTIAIGSNPGSGTLSGTLTAYTNVWGQATFTGLSVNKAGTGYTLVASSPGYAGTVSSAFTVTPAAATQLVVTGPATGTASSTATIGPFAVQRQDAYGNPVITGSTAVTLASNSAGTKVFALTSGGATVASATIPAGASSASFFYGDTKAGTARITLGSTLTSQPVDVTITPAAPSTLAFGPGPIAPVKNVTITPAVIVSILDGFGNLTTSTASVTLQSICNLKGTLTHSATGGVASFATLVFNGNGTNCTIVANSGSLPSVTSNSFNIN